MQHLATSSASVNRTTLDKDGKQFTRKRTLKFPVAFQDPEDAKWLMTVASVTKEAMNHVLHVLCDKFFVPFSVTLGNGEVKTITLFDLFDKKSGIKGPFTYNGKQVNKCICPRYIIREIFNPKCPLAGATTEDIVEFIESRLPEGADVTAAFVKESIYMRIQAMVDNAVEKKLNRTAGNSRKDRTWSSCCREASSGEKTDSKAATLARQLELVGFQLQAMNNGGTPSVDRWPKKCSVEKPELTKKFLAAYRKAVELFKAAFRDAFPVIRRQALLYCPGIQLDWETRDTGKFFDVPGKITGIPSRGKARSVKVRIRTVSGHSDNYYPEDVAGCLKAVPVVGIRFSEGMAPESACSPDGLKATRETVLGHFAANIATVNTSFSEDRVLPEEGVGIDLNVAAFLMNTTLRVDEAVDAVDWAEAVRAFRSECPVAYPFTMPYRRSVNDLNAMADSAGDKERLLGVIPLVGLRDGKPADAAHGWKGSPDPLSTLFTWMLRRPGKNGKPFYTEGQLAQIGHTRDFRKLVRSETANRLHYFDEQSRWDLTHDGKVEPFSDTDAGKALLAERAGLQARIEKEFVRLAVTGLVDNAPGGRIQYIKMEDVDLSEIKDKSSAKSLWGTAKDEWGMCDGKLSCKNGVVEFFTECPFNMDAVRSTDYWTVVSAVREGDTVKVTAEPTGKYNEETARHWIDAYTHRALHLSSIKKIVGELCIKRGIHFALVNPAHTSQLCHVCRSAEHINRRGSSTAELRAEQCMARHVNFRKGRTFVCGNPECRMCGVKQNADDNAAMNVLLPEIFIRNIRVKHAAA